MIIKNSIYIDPIFKDSGLTKFIKNFNKKGGLNLSFKIYYKFFNLYFIKKKKIIIKKKSQLKQNNYLVLLKLIESNNFIFKKFKANYYPNNFKFIKNNTLFYVYTKKKNKVNIDNLNNQIFLKHIKKITSIFYYKILFKRNKKIFSEKIVNPNKLLNLSIKSFLKYSLLKYKNKSTLNKIIIEFDLLYNNKSELIKKLNLENKNILKKKYFILRYVK